MRLERNPNYGNFHQTPGSKDLGWQLSGTEKELVTCRQSGHKTREFDNSHYKFRCTDVITICDECKYFYHTDMSD
jgi:hypothetical protein